MWPLLLSACLHLGVLVPFLLFHEDAKVLLDRGTHAVEVNLVFSVESRPSEAAPDPDPVDPSPDEPEVEPDEKEPPQPVEEEVPPPEEESPQEKAVVAAPPDRPSRVEEPAVQSPGRAAQRPVESAPPPETARPDRRPAPPQPTLEVLETAALPRPEEPPPDPVKRIKSPRQPSEKPAPDSRRNEGDRPEKGVTSPVVVEGLSRPEYPRYSRIHGEEGRVVLSVVVHSDGSPGKIEVVRSSGYRRLDRAAVQALQRATFLPARLGGRAIESTKRISFRFQLED